MLSAQVVGRVQQVLVREGDYVSAGQTLAILDDATLRASAEQADAAVSAAENQQIAAKSNADLAASTLARYKQLQEQKSVSPQEMDEVARRADASEAEVAALKAQANAAKAQASGAQAMLRYTRIRAPFAGVITARIVDPGALAAPGVPLLQIDRDGPLQLEATVDESAIAAVHVGMSIPISVDGASIAGETGQVEQIVPAADPSSHTFLIKIALAPSKQLRAGMYGTAEFPIGTHQAILVPGSAIVARGSLLCAYVLDSNDIAQLRYVTTGASQGNLVEVLSGISAGEKLVDESSRSRSRRAAHRSPQRDPAMNQNSHVAGLGLAGRLAQTFLNSKLTPLFIVASLALGVFAVAIIPREEEPQILVPMLDITTAMPGASPAEVEQRVTLPIETLVHQISGVEYVYSTSSPGQSLVIVRFLVGTPQEDALIKVYSKLYSNFDRMPPGVSQPIIKARSIDDVPILSLTLWGQHYNAYQLRAIADEIQHNINQISDVSETSVIGGLPRTMRVVLSTAKLNAYGLSPMTIVGQLQAANAGLQAGSFAENNSEIRVDAGNLFTSKKDLESVVVAVDHGRPVFLRDVADQIIDGPAEPTDYVVFGTTNASA